MSESKCKHILYRNEKIDVGEDGWVTIENERYLVINSLRECEENFKVTKGEDFKFLDDISTNKKYLDEKCIFNFELPLIDFSSSTEVESVLYIFCNNIFLKKVTIKQGYGVSGVSGVSDRLFKVGVISIPNFAFWNAKFEDECLIEFDHNKNDLSFIFNQCHFSKKLKIRNSERRLQLPGGTDFSEYEIAQKTKLHLSKLHLKNCSVNDGVYLRIGFVSVEDFVLSNLKLPQNTELSIGDCHFKNFQLTNFRNIGNFKLYKINILKIKHKYFDNPCEEDETKGNKKFQIDNTSIGKTNFQSINLSSFTEIKIFDNIFTEIDYTNIIWSDKVVGVGQCNNDTSKLSKQQDSYRTLKNVALRNNDQPQAVKFYAKEMEFYRKLVKGNKSYSWSDRATLWFNKRTNNFGLSFWKPLRLLLLLSIVFYFFVLCSFLDGYNSNYWRNIFEFLNPTHKVLFINEYHWSGWSYFWDFLFRIIEGLLIYQTIQAFRKYSKKL